MRPALTRSTAAGAGETDGDWMAPLWRPAVVACADACCCPAAPLYQVLIPPPAGCLPAELLLCSHHFQASLTAICAARGWVYNAAGELVDSPR